MGGAFTDSAGIILNKLSPELQKNLVRDYFGQDGLMYTMGRVPVGGSDFSTHAYSYDDTPNDESLSKFALQDGDLKDKIPFIKMAEKEAGKLKLISRLGHFNTKTLSF